MENRHVEAAAWVAHGLRNLLAPGQLRLDAWILRGTGVTLGTDDLQRMRNTLQEVVQIMDGLELLRTAPADRNARVSTPWPDALRALLSCIASGATGSLTLVGDAKEVARKAPQVVVTHLLVDLALASQRAAPGVQATYRLGITNDVVNVSATFSRTAADGVDTLTCVLRDATEAVLLSANVSSATLQVGVNEQGEVECQINVPVTGAQGASDAVPYTGREGTSFSVLAIDDNDHLLDALEMRLKQANGFSHFLRADSLKKALDQLEQASVSLVLVDVHLSTSHDPMAAIQILRAKTPNARVALFSGRADEVLMQRAMANGADGFVFKGMASHDLIDAIVRLARGENVWAADAD